MNFLILEDLVVDASRILKIIPCDNGDKKTCIVLFDCMGVESKEFSKTPFNEVAEAMRTYLTNK